MTPPPKPVGRAIFLTGIPSAGKSTVAGFVQNRAPSLEIISGDDAVRRMSPAHQRLRQAHDLFLRLLDLVEGAMASNSVLVDMTLSATYVTEARARFGAEAIFVSIRVDEDERRQREFVRKDRSPVAWNHRLTGLQGPEDLYDLVLDSSTMTPEECAAAVIGTAELVV